MDKAIEALIKNSPLALIIIGLILFVVGAAGGWPYPSLHVVETGWRVALAVMGAVIAALGGLLLWRDTDGQEASASAKRYEIKIDSHRPGAIVEGPFQLQGTFKKIPTGKGAIFEVSKQRHYYFKNYINFDANDKRWSAWVKPGPSEEITLMVVVLGKAGQALTDYSIKVKERYGDRPGIDTLTPDVKKCAEINIVKRESPAQRLK